MAKTYDNIDNRFTEGLQGVFSNVGVKRVDFCVGYFNLRGWDLIVNQIEQLSGKEDKNRQNSICEKVKKDFSDITQLKLNAGKYVGTFNTKKLRHLTDQSDRIFYKYMNMNVGCYPADRGESYCDLCPDR